jgi:diguanylate cyclase (GGDEF)-like protein/PAS domain S-box-containing protein
MLPFLPNATVPAGAVVRRAALIFLPVAGVLALVVLLGMRLDAQFRRNMTETRERSRVELAREEIVQNFDEIDADLRVVANLPTLKRYLDSRSPAWRNAVSQLFWQLAYEKRRYDQIRYLDSRGREIIRINFNDGAPVAVPQAELQDKADRYYFRDAIKLGRNEVYVSPLDLNIEQQGIEIPYKPMIRFATPVFDSAGRKQGVLVFNYLGEKLLDRFREVMGRGARRPMLLNGDGYWLEDADPANEWGFMLGREDRTFAHDYPEEWRAVSGAEQGALLTARGLFVYDTVYPLLSQQHAVPAARERAARAYRWKVISYIPQATLARDSLFRQPAIRLLVGAACLLLALGSWAIAVVSLSRRQAQLALSSSNARYDELTRTLPVGVYQFRFHADGSYRFEYVSPVFCDILGVHAALVLADAGTAFSAAHPDDAESLLSANREASRTLVPFRWDGRFIVRGETRWLRIASDPTQHGDWGSVWSGVVSDITERKQLELELEHQARFDMLTGLSNRRYFFELAEKEMARARRHNETFAMLMLDADHFKQVNDTCGHDVGDTVLRKLGEVCTGVLRGNDIMGRMGGEEFAILLPETTLEQALETAERLRQAVADAAVQLADGKALRFTVSAGVASLRPEDENVDAILKRADAALYAAKHAGRNRVRAA